MSTKQHQRRFDASAAAVHAAVTAAAHDSVAVQERDDQAGVLVWQTPRSLFSWGHIVRAQVVPNGTGAVLELVVTGLPDAPRALMDGKKNDAMARRVLDAVDAQLTGH